MERLCACGCGQSTNSTFVRGHHWKVQAKQQALEPPNPSGICLCGCGQPAPIAPVTVHRKGQVKGHALRYIRGHASTKHKFLPPPNPSGLCMCGCGRTTQIAKKSDPRDGVIIGQHRKFIHNHHGRPEMPRYRIEDRGYKTPCWIWQWHIDEAGYGRVVYNGRFQPAHRAYYKMLVGPIPPGLDLDHLCFVRCCINPEHMEPVTPIVNTWRRRCVRLSMDKIPTIKQLHEWGATDSAIGHLFGVKSATIFAARTGLNWKGGS